MGRVIRQDFDGAWHHVMNRGTNHQRVFFNTADGRRFLALLEDGTQQFGIEIHAFCLMPNHFHLLVRCPDGGLSSFMHWLTSRYVQQLNFRLDRDGPIFRGRFRSVVVDSELYVARAGRYIHRNPIDIRPAVALDRYRWSSYRFYVGVEPAPPWIHTSYLLQSASSYREFVENQLRSTSVDVARLMPAIDLVIDQLSDTSGTAVRGLRRTLAVAAAQSVDAGSRRTVLTELGLAEGDALARAIRRANAAVAREPELSGLLARALDLAA
jgi:REP element-mobilizing transposase RayT